MWPRNFHHQAVYAFWKSEHFSWFFWTKMSRRPSLWIPRRNIHIAFTLAHVQIFTKANVHGFHATNINLSVASLWFPFSHVVFPIHHSTVIRSAMINLGYIWLQPTLQKKVDRLTLIFVFLLFSREHSDATRFPVFSTHTKCQTKYSHILNAYRSSTTTYAIKILS